MLAPRITKFVDKPWPALGLILLVAFALRLSYVATLANSLNITFEADPITYDQLARNLLAGRPYIGASFYFPDGSENATALWDPLYPLFLAGIYSLFGHDLLVVRLVQVFLGVASCGLLYLLGHSIFNPPIGLTVSCFAAIYPFFIYYTGQVLTETLFIFLLLIVLTLANSIAKGQIRGTKAVLALGISAGVTVLTRAEALYFAVLLLAILPWGTIRTETRRWPALRARFTSAFLVLAVFICTLAPWVLFNYSRFGQVFITTKLGYNIYKYYHPRMTPDQRTRFNYTDLPAMTGLSEPERAEMLLDEGLGFVTSDPARTGRFMLAKAGLLFKLKPSNEINQRYAMVSLLSYGSLIPFMVTGAFLSLRRWRLTWPLLLWVGMGSASSILVFAGIRLRMRIEPILLLFAAVGMVALIRWLWSGRPTRPETS